MDGMENGIESLLNELALATQSNMSDEAEAVAGYTRQGVIIRKLRDAAKAAGDFSLAIQCDDWERENDELISDELNHQQVLNALYQQITGIKAAKT